MSNTPHNPDDELLFQLSEYLDGALEPVAAAQLERRLQSDPELRQELEAMRLVDQLAQEHAQPVPELDWERFTWESRRRRDEYNVSLRRCRIYRLFAPLTAAAAALAIGITGVFWVASNGGRVRETLPVAHADRPIAKVEVFTYSAHTTSSDEVYAEVKVSRTVPAGFDATARPASTGKIVVAMVGDSSFEEMDQDDTATLF